MVKVQAPSNIALIKYMGKSQVEGNRPTNASLSYTLNHLVTEVVVEESRDGQDQVQALPKEEYSLVLSEKGKKRFLDFFTALKREFSIPGHHVISSGNNFPSDCGLASSASSFAALTKATYELARSKGVLSKEWSPEELARLSQKGSGSSCRSFFSPFSLWDDEGARAIDLGIDQLLHSVLILEDSKKEVSSSQAHVQVLTSSLFKGRVERAENRLKALIEALRSKDWKRSYQICWEEFWDMHVLFETSVPSFGYLNGSAITALNELRSYWKENGDGPLVTMDAGPNVHLLFRPDQADVRTRILGRLQAKIPSMGVLSS